MKETVDYRIKKNDEKKEMIGCDGRLFVPEYIGVALTEVGHLFAAFCGCKETKVGVESPKYRVEYTESALKGFVSMITVEEVTIELDGVKIYDPRHKELEELDARFWKTKNMKRKEEIFHEMFWIKKQMGIVKI